MILGVLEHLLFKLYEKGITPEINTFGPREGLEMQIVIQIKPIIFVYIITNKQRISYYIREEDKRKLYSKASLLKFIESL